jgi:TetR/AcrR family transcriptional regulator, regulator of autoinduction and epiphytic fitness
MKAHNDRRALRGQLIKEQVREGILTAYTDLIRGGDPQPTAHQTAERAGVSLRTIFNHFVDLRALRLASFNRILASSRQFFTSAVPGRASANERIEFFLEHHARRLESVTPFQRTAAMVEDLDPDVAKALREARNDAARNLANALGPTLRPFSSRRRKDLLMKLHVVCSWESWEFLRGHYRLSPTRARAAMRGIAFAVFAAADRARYRRSSTDG